MPSVTLAESAKLSQDELVSGVIANVITVNKMYELLPFDGIDGNSLAYNRENVLGDVQVATVGDTITAKNAATFTKVNSNLTTPDPIDLYKALRLMADAGCEYVVMEVSAHALAI